MSARSATYAIEGILGFLLIALVFLRGGEGVYQLALLHIGAIVLFMIWLAVQLNQQKAVVFRFPGLLALTGFAFCILLSTLASNYIYGSFYGLVEWFCYLLVFFVVYQLRRPFSESYLCETLIALTAIQAVYGLFQSFILKIPRISGSYSIPNYYADLMLIGISLLTARLLFQPIKPHQKAIYGGLTGLMLLALYRSESRGALITGGIILLTLLGFKNLRRTTLLTLVIIILTLVVPNRLKDRFFEQDRYTFTRFQIWQQAGEIIRDQPFLGIGLLNYNFYGIKYNFPVESAVGRFAKSPEIAHQQYLQIAAEIGLPGFIFLAWFIIAFFRQKLKQPGQAISAESGEIAAVSVFLIHGLVDNTLYTPANCLILFIILAYLSPQTTSLDISLPTRNPTAAKFYPLTLSIIFIVLFAFKPISETLYFQALDLIERRGSLDEAVKTLETADLLSPLNARISRLLGEAYGRKYFQDPQPNWLNLSDLALTRSLKHNPMDSFSALSLASTRRLKFLREKSIDHFNAAVDAYQQGLSWNPRNALIWDELGVFYAENDQFEKAINCFSNAINLEPNLVRSHQHISMLFMAVKDTVKMQEFARNAIAAQQKFGSEKNLLPFEIELLKPDTLYSKRLPNLD